MDKIDFETAGKTVGIAGIIATWFAWVLGRRKSRIDEMKAMVSFWEESAKSLIEQIKKLREENKVLIEQNEKLIEHNSILERRVGELEELALKNSRRIEQLEKSRR